MRFTFVGEGDKDIVNCGLDQNPENFIYLCYKLAGFDNVPDLFMDKIYNAISRRNQDAYAHGDENGTYYNLFSLIKRENKNRVKENIIKVFGKANEQIKYKEYKDADFDFIDNLNLAEKDFIVCNCNENENLTTELNSKLKPGEKEIYSKVYSKLEMICGEYEERLISINAEKKNSEEISKAKYKAIKDICDEKNLTSDLKLNEAEIRFILKIIDNKNEVYSFAKVFDNKYLNLIGDKQEKSEAFKKICNEIISRFAEVNKTDLEDVISRFDFSYCKEQYSFNYDSKTKDYSKIKELINDELLFYLKSYLAHELTEINKNNAKPDIDPKVINVNEDNAAVYFFLSVCYSVMLPVYESENKEQMAKLLKNLEQVCSDFSTGDLDSGYLNIKSCEDSYYKAFVKKIAGSNIDEKKLDSIKENQEKMSNVLYGTNVVSEIAAVWVKKELIKGQDKTQIVRVSNDHLLVSDLFFGFCNWFSYVAIVFDEIQKKYDYKYEFCSTKDTEYKNRIEDFVSELMMYNIGLFFELSSEIQLFVLYKLINSGKSRIGKFRSMDEFDNVISFCYRLPDDFFTDLEKISDNKIKEDISLKVVQMYLDDSKFDHLYSLIKTLVSNSNFKELFKTICNMDPISNDKSIRARFQKYLIRDIIDEKPHPTYFSYLNPYLLVDNYDYIKGDSKKFQFEANSLVFWDYFGDNKCDTLDVSKLLISLARYLILIPEDLKNQAKERVKTFILNDSEIKNYDRKLLRNFAKYSKFLDGRDKPFNDLDELINFVIDNMDYREIYDDCFAKLSEKAHKIEECPEPEREPVKFFYRILKIIEQYIYDLSKSDECFERNKKNIEEFVGLNYKFTAYFSPDIVFRLIENKDVQKYLSLLDAEKNKGQIKYITDEAKKIKDGWTRKKIFNILWDCNNAFKKGFGIVPFKKSISERFFQALANDKSPKTQKNNESKNLE